MVGVLNNFQADLFCLISVRQNIENGTHRKDRGWVFFLLCETYVIFIFSCDYPALIFRQKITNPISCFTPLIKGEYKGDLEYQILMTQTLQKYLVFMLKNQIDVDNSCYFIRM